MSDRRWLGLEIQPALGDWPAEDWAAACADALAPLGCLGTEERGSGMDLRIIAWLPSDADLADVHRALRAAALDARIENASITEDPGWVEQWNASLVPVDVGERLTILPAPGPAPPGRLAIVIEPGRAFGTGHHESTRLALVHLEAMVAPGHVVLDVGTGSGILALAAARLGAASVTGLDIDPEAIEVATTNIEGQPEASRVRLLVCDGIQGVTGAFDVIIANITRDVIEPMLAALCERLAPGGRLILSGLLAIDRQPIASALAAARMDASWLAEGEWVSACAWHR